MNVKVTFEFPSIEHAISWLGTKVMAGAPAKTVQDSPARPAPTAGAPATPKRKGRADKGMPRGPHKNAAPDAITTSAAPTPAPVAPVAAPNAAATAPIPAEGDKPQPSGILSGAAAPKKTLDEARTALQKVYESKGANVALALLSRYGTNRVVAVPEDLRGEFVAHAERVLSGEAA